MNDATARCSACSSALIYTIEHMQHEYKQKACFPKQYNDNTMQEISCSVLPFLDDCTVHTHTRTE